MNMTELKREWKDSRAAVGFIPVIIPTKALSWRWKKTDPNHLKEHGS